MAATARGVATVIRTVEAVPGSPLKDSMAAAAVAAELSAVLWVYNMAVAAHTVSGVGFFRLLWW